MKLQTARLLRLAQHLEAGKLGHDRFDFRFVTQVDYPDGYPCRTAGCAMGELPLVFPRAFAFDSCPPRSFVGARHRFTIHRIGGHDNLTTELCRWFGITEAESDHLFIPGTQSPDLYGGEYLGSAATKEQVGAGIRAFVAIREAQR